MTFLFLIFSFFLSGQEKQILNGMAYDQFTHSFPDRILITSLVPDKTAFSEVKRKTSISVPFDNRDTLWKSYKNVIGILPLELVTGSIGLMYLRFIKPRHSVGIYSSVYLFGYGHTPFGGGNSKFKGFKLAPFYRYYVWRKTKTGGFIQGKAIIGYFNFHQLYYAWDVDSRYGEYRSEQFWNAGFSVAWGFSFKLPRFTHGVFELTAGYQYFTMSVPPTTHSDQYGILEVDSLWWYLFGPGSMVEIKLIFGGIF